MKRKNYIFSLALALLMGTMTMSLTACSSEDIVANNTQQPAQGEVRTYTVSIPATFSDNAGTRAVAFDNSGSTPAITTKFVEGEKVYVYNKTTPALLGGYLVVKNVSADMKSCELQGQLTGTGTINPDDEVALLYNLSVINTPVNDHIDLYYNYDGQIGTAASCVDGAKATMKVKAIDASNNYKMTFYAVGDETTKTQAKAVFANLQSMFRFQFADATAPTTPIKVKNLNIQSKNTALANRYFPTAPSSQGMPITGGIDIKPETATADYLYVALFINEVSAPDDVLYFWVTDDEGNEYRGSKAAPTGGFANGKYYYNSAPIALTKQPAKAAPVITWTDPSVAVTPSEYTYKYTFETAYPGSADITIANASGKGYCNGYAFNITNNATIRLNAVNAIWNYQDSPFIYVDNGDATLVLTGDNAISCNGNKYAIYCSALKLSCTGTSATLTVKTKTAQGMFGGTNYHSAPILEPENNFVVSNLAADGYTVERTGGTSPDADGVYTTTYTVTSLSPFASVTAADLGKVIGNDSKIYADKITAEDAGATAVAIIAYVGSDNGESAPFNHGLALALSDANGGNTCNWSISNTKIHTYNPGDDNFATESGLQYNDATHNTTDYPAFQAARVNNGTTAPTGCSAWFLASGYQWTKMIAGNASALKTLAGLKTNFSYWSSSELSYSPPEATNAWCFKFNGDGWIGDYKSNNRYVRSCLAF